MPNWCENSLRLQHDDAEMIARAKTAYTRGELLAEFVPLPNGEWDYSWCVDNWGTKWDVGGGNFIVSFKPGEVDMAFDSAWAPPIAAYERLQDLGFRVIARYYEPNMAFCGIFDETGDTCYDLSNMTAAEVANTIPVDLDTEFGISAGIAELEDDEPVTGWYRAGVEATGLEPHVVEKEKINV
jgi:hypothetical protein